jgi:hypothetical protein
MVGPFVTKQGLHVALEEGGECGKIRKKGGGRRREEGEGARAAPYATR